MRDALGDDLAGVRNDDEALHLATQVGGEELVVIAERHAAVGIATRSKHEAVRQDSVAAEHLRIVLRSHAQGAHAVEQFFAHRQFVDIRRRHAAIFFAHGARIVETITGTKGIASSKVAFVGARTGHKEIYIADYDGANGRQLTNDSSISVRPAISWDGAKLAYTGYKEGFADIYAIDLASGSRNRIIKFPGTNSGAAYSPDGGRIACTMSKEGNPELFVVGSSGGSARRLTRTHGVASSPTWSPNGGELIYSSDERGGPQLFRIGAGGGSGRLLSAGYGYCTEPNWSPDGKKVVFNVRQGGFSIAVLDLTSGATRIVAEGETPVWGADSRHIIYSTGSSINLLDTLKGRITPVITGLGKVTEPTWSR